MFIMHEYHAKTIITLISFQKGDGSTIKYPPWRPPSWQKVPKTCPEDSTLFREMSQFVLSEQLYVKDFAKYGVSECMLTLYMIPNCTAPLLRAGIFIIAICGDWSAIYGNFGSRSRPYKCWKICRSWVGSWYKFVMYSDILWLACFAILVSCLQHACLLCTYLRLIIVLCILAMSKHVHMYLHYVCMIFLWLWIFSKQWPEASRRVSH